MNLYEILKQLNIKFEEVEHEAVFTAEEAQIVKDKIEGKGCKNLFLTDKKNRYVLAILDENKKANIKLIEKELNLSHLSFAKVEDLKEVLKLEAGSVTPFGIINDKDKKVLIIIDNDLKGKKLLFHPNTNDKTISILFDDLLKFIDFEEHNYKFL